MGPSVELYDILLRTVCPGHEEQKASVNQLPSLIGQSLSDNLVFLHFLVVRALVLIYFPSASLTIVPEKFQDKKQEVRGRYPKAQ